VIELQPEKGSIIDVGCGAGRHSKYLASKGFNVTGIDTAFSSIQLARSYQSALLRFFNTPWDPHLEKTGLIMCLTSLPASDIFKASKNIIR
jgi:SAM-dependent methyltransferase